MGGFYILKQAEHKSRAMSVAYLKLNQFLGVSYKDLKPDVYAGIEDFGQYADRMPFSWYVDVTENSLEHPKQANLKIPYKNINVTVSYNETGFSDSYVIDKTVNLKNIKAYSFIHSDSNTIQFDSDDSSAPEALYYDSSSAGIEYQDNHNIMYSQEAKALTLKYEVPKNIMVIYNMAINAKETTDVLPADAIRTRCFFDGKEQGIETETPILSQPFISNTIVISNVEPSKSHSLEIRWKKIQDRGKVFLRNLEISVLAYETRLP
jgi:hypothetical protein